MGVTIENLVTSGTFSLDGGTWDVDNNVWIVGNDDECVIIDSPHDAAAIINPRPRSGFNLRRSPGMIWAQGTPDMPADDY